MDVNAMSLSNPGSDLIANEGDLLEDILPLQGAAVLELGCGKAEKTRIVAKEAASVLALEVDEIQLSKNRVIPDLPNVTFAYGGAETIPADDSIFDLVLMFKSLHHVPVELMDEAFSEMSRVLRPGGLAYISEPVYAGDFNDILKLFHDEKHVREAAFAAEKRAVLSGKFALVTQKYFLQPMHFDSFSQFEDQVIKVSHSDHQLSRELVGEVRLKFDQHMSAEGANFFMPIRIDLLKKVNQEIVDA